MHTDTLPTSWKVHQSWPPDKPCVATGVKQRTILMPVPDFQSLPQFEKCIACEAPFGCGDPSIGQVTGRSGDGGIDGTIREDTLGLDEV